MSIGSTHKLVYDERVTLANVSIKVHCWGGLGSQLYAWALLEELRLTHPRRDTQLILHSSGVTERGSELSFLEGTFNILKVRDFALPKASELPPSYSGRIFFCIKSFLRMLLIRFRFVLEVNSDLEMLRIMPWTRSLRGHYSHRTIPYEVLSLMFKRIEMVGQLAQFTTSHSREPSAALHMRLGDLISLNSKDPIPFESVIGQLSAALLNFPYIQTLEIASDSLEIALPVIQNQFSRFQILEVSGSALEIIHRFQRSKIFVGTNSKVSVWVTLFLLSHNKSCEIYLPIGIAHHLRANLSSVEQFRKIHFY